ncbi:MAG: hypothetical protein IPM53_21495 [Anaerolineaceae bacterium]|nr:hypothetical protein [Anaerolineaceae bacterium]
MNDKTLSTNELIDALENAGRTPDLDLIRTCVARVAELEPALLDLLRTTPEERYDDMEDEMNDPRIYSDVHAGYLLITARSLAALPIFGEIFRDEERQDLFEWFAPELHHYGSAALPVFTELLLDEAGYLYGRSWAAAILRKIAQLEPEQRTAVIATLHQLLPPVPPGKVEARDEMWTWAVLELGKLGDKTHLEQIEALFAAGAIDTWIIGEYEDYLELLEEDPGDMSPSYDIIEIYTELHDEAASEAEVRAEWARRNEAKTVLPARQKQNRGRVAGHTGQAGRARR